MGDQIELVIALNLSAANSFSTVYLVTVLRLQVSVEG